MGKNLATKYSKKVDERFYRESQAMMALNNDYEFTGVETVKVYSIPTVAMTDYQRSGNNRYGEAKDLTRNVQTMTVTKDRAFTFIIDKGDKLQSEMVMDAGKALSRQTREVMVPEFDTYVFNKLAEAAIANGNYSESDITDQDAYSALLDAQEALGNANVPDQGRVCFCSYKYANQLKKDPAFMRYSNTSQEMLIKGVIGEVDGCKIVKVPSSRLPVGASFLLVHPIAATAPKQLQDYKIHDNPPGINGWLVEGRVIYDCFVLDEKSDAIYFHKSPKTLSKLVVNTAATGTGKSTVTVQPGAAPADCTRYYKAFTAASEIPAVTPGEAFQKSTWTQLSKSGEEISTSSSNKVIAVVDLKTSGDYPVAVGRAKLNVG